MATPEAPTAPTLSEELSSLLNCHSAEQDSDTPDLILANYLLACLGAWNAGVRRREEWYGRAVGTEAAAGPVPMCANSPEAAAVTQAEEGVGCLRGCSVDGAHTQCARLVRVFWEPLGADPDPRSPEQRSLDEADSSPTEVCVRTGEPRDCCPDPDRCPEHHPESSPSEPEEGAAFDGWLRYEYRFRLESAEEGRCFDCLHHESEDGGECVLLNIAIVNARRSRCKAWVAAVAQAETDIDPAP